MSGMIKRTLVQGDVDPYVLEDGEPAKSLDVFNC